ncbi:stage V sporulation protein AE [Bacillus paralicheniformis]|jgi:stage V sporulation protein AE|uniref:Stage V sporulation protein AE n=1 Tax=Bacillus paralicheniformis TaxID=1648923 RepID=A0A6N2GRC3_9BACI|nr:MULTISPECIES: stage V sporulation protein AE [Bacillus]ETB69624.1 stage V sporulation protein AE [Bacillus sp. CPSM8]KJD55231.1 stage V sporulation protein AE [Bacillus amyloliquefaciens]KUL06775.1 stage V sporulation protein AE [Bacillus licheniformis LMG 7559]KUL15650.1 stage V sporulation protein AE [Bacillus licheniformis LMG 6934]MBC8623186.1 stage V sporulation protein AE [Robertmurraya crescens]POO80813.1 stage V sporulation protein AE [Bacillus sp. MBGLi97]
MPAKRKVILVTDGDIYAAKAIEYAARKTGGRCISQSAGNPSIKTGPELVSMILETPHDPVFVMFDDSGLQGEGPGETAMKYVAMHADIEVLGVIAVASKTHYAEWTRIDVSIDAEGELTEFGVDKHGVKELDVKRMNGDTVYCLDQLDVPIIVGIGDIGKMNRKDDVEKGSPITMKAVELILERSGYHECSKAREDERIP